MAAGRVELFVNVIWRELGMAVQQRPSPGHGLAKTLDDIFAGSDWRRIGGEDALERMHDAAELISDLVGAKWDTRIRMTTGGSAIRYILLHLTNHDQGRDLMKECAWKVAPDGSFEVLQRDNPKQPLLVTPSPDLTSLRTWGHRASPATASIKRGSTERSQVATLAADSLESSRQETAREAGNRRGRRRQPVSRCSTIAVVTCAGWRRRPFFRTAAVSGAGGCFVISELLGIR